MQEELIVKAIKTFLDSKPSSDLRTRIGQGYYFGVAPSSASGVYMVYLVFGVGPAYYMGATVVEEYEVQFNIFESNQSAAGVLAAGKALCALFDDTAEISISGYSLLLFERKTTICFEPQTEEQVVPDQQYTATYRVLIYK